MALTTTKDENNQPYPHDIKLLNKKVDELQAAVTALVTLANELKADLNAHVHTGVTVGAGSTGAVDRTTTAADVAL